MKRELHEPALEVRVENALKAIDWDFDVDAMNESRLKRGAQALKQTEALIGSLYDIKPTLAQAMWEMHCPYAQPGSLTASVLRR